MIINKLKVSIIIPCYNVGQYIEKCISSITNQTYRNLEIIAVEDGAKDETPIILNKLADQDNRIVVLHKENAGVSAARNSGLEIAKGDYIVFVDGDDYLSPDYVEYMIKLASKSDAEFVLSKNCYTRVSEPQVKDDKIEILTPAQATSLLISPRLIVGCWNKMFKKSFLDNHRLRFSTTLFYGEGLNFIIEAAQLANCVIVGSRKVYFYRRNNEASATSMFNIHKYYNGEKALDRIEKKLIFRDDDVLLMISLHKSMFCLGAITQTYAHCLQNDYSIDCIHWQCIIKHNLPKLLKSNKVSLYRKALLSVGFYFPSLVSKLDIWRRKRISKQSVK